MKKDVKVLTLVMSIIVLYNVPEGISEPRALEYPWYIKGEIGYIYPMRFKGNNPYEKIGLNGSLPKSSPLFEIEAGYRFTEQLSLGVALQYSKHKFDNDHYIISPIGSNFDHATSTEYMVYSTMLQEHQLNVKTYSLMFNGYYNFRNVGNLKPYLMLGAGVSHHNNKSYKPELWIRQSVII